MSFFERINCLLSFPETHPYVKFEGLTEEDDIQLQSIREAADAWRNPKLWNYAEADENGIRFDTEKLALSEEAAQIIQSQLYWKTN